MMQLFKSSTKETMNFLRYVGPGLLVTVGFIDNKGFKNIILLTAVAA